MSQKPKSLHRLATEADTEAKNTSRTEDIDSCPECAGNISNDPSHGEFACDDCGLVVSEDEIDRGPEWRAFNSSEQQSKSRVGSPITNTMHDDGLTTKIGSSNRDSRGNLISGEKRMRMKRIRRWHERIRTQSAEERNLQKALTEMQRMVSALGLPDSTHEVASMVYRQALNKDLIRGRSLEGMSTASLLAACRIDGIPRTIDEVALVSRVEQPEIMRAFRYISEELSLEIKPVVPIEYLPRIASKFAVPNEVEASARDLICEFQNAGGHSGKHPMGVAAAGLYLSNRLIGNETLTQDNLAAETDVSAVTIRNRKDEMLDMVHDGDISVKDQNGDNITKSMTATTTVPTISDSDAKDMTDEELDDDFEAVIVSCKGSSEPQSDALARTICELIETYGLLDEIPSLPYKPAERYDRLWLSAEPRDDTGCWREVSGDDYGVWVQTKLNKTQKKNHLKVFGRLCGVKVTFENW